MATLIGTAVELVLGTAQTPATQSVAVPVGATGVFLVYSADGWNADGEKLNTATLDSAAPTNSYDLVSATGYFVATGARYWRVSSTGSKSLDLSWTSAPIEGPTCFVFFTSNEPAATGWSAISADHDTSATAFTTTLSCSVGDLVVKYDQRYDASNDSPPALSAGWANLGTTAARRASENARLSSITATGTSQICDSETEEYSSVVAMVIPDAGSSAEVDQEGSRFGVDDGSESTHTWAQAQDANDSGVSVGTARLIRMLLNGTGDPASASFTLRYQKNGAGGYVAVPVGASVPESYGTVTFGAIGTGANGGTTVAPQPASPPAGAYMVAVITSGATNNETPTAPDGTWALLATGTSTDGTYGVDTGPRRVTVFGKVATGSEGTTAITFSITNGGTCRGTISHFTKAGSGSWVVDAVGAGDSTSGTDFSATGGSLNWNTGDAVLVATGQRVDSATQSAQSLTAPGVTFGTRTNRAATAVTTGNDHRHTVDTFAAVSATSNVNAAPTWAYTASAAVSGGVVFVRLREYTAPVTNQIYVSPSANIAASGEATTARLTAPASKSTSDFVTGRRWDDENGSDSIDITVDDYTEIEWCINTQSPAVNGDYFDFRVYAGASALASYSVTPRLTLGAASPNITGTSSATPAKGSTLTITGTSFGASQGTKSVRIGGVTQTVTSWGDTSIQVTVDEGTNKFGVAVNVEIWDGTLQSNSFALTNLQPQSGWAYVNIATPNTTAANRLTASPDIASGDQVSYETVSGGVTVFDDCTFSADTPVTEFDFRVWTSPDGWGSVATQTVGSGGTKTFSLSAVVQLSQSLASSLSVAVEETRQQSANISLAVQESRVATAAVDAAVQNVLTSISNIDVAVQALDVQASTGVSAVVQEAKILAASLGAAIQEARSGVVSIGAVVQLVNTLTSQLDAVVQATNSHAMSLDTAIQEAKNATFGLNAQIQADSSVTVSLDTAIQAALQVTTQLDTVVSLAQQAQTSLQTAVLAETTHQVGIDAQVEASAEKSAQITAAILHQNKAVQTAVDLAVQTPGQGTIAIDVAVQRALSVASAIQTAVQEGKSALSGIDAYVQSQNGQAVSLQAAVQESKSAGTGIDVAILAATTSIVSLSAYVQAAFEASAQISAAVQDTHSLLATIDAAIQSAYTAAHVVDTAIQEARSASVGLNAQIQGGSQAITALDVAIRQSAIEMAALDAAISTSLQTATGISAAVAETFSWFAQLDAVVVAQNSRIAGLGVYIEDPTSSPAEERDIVVTSEKRDIDITAELRDIVVPAMVEI